jgi:poly(3-hydroxybutyrate) depolymerase
VVALAVRSLTLLLAAVALVVPVRSAALELVPDFGDNPGGLAMYVHRPADFRPGLPVVVGLHGCKQTAEDFDDETGLVALAEETPFVLLLPEQSDDNMALRCFRWYDADDNLPGQGESASILSMVDDAIDRYAVDRDRVYVLGLSAGGAMTAVMLTNHPGRFAGGAIIAGVPYGCNRPSGTYDLFWYSLHWSPLALDGADASYACGIGGFSTTDRDAAEWGGFVRDAAGATPGTWPPVSIWQGAADRTVDPGNLEELVDQWTDVHGIDAIADARETVLGATHDTYRDAMGRARVEAWTIGGFPHAFPIDPDGDAETCGIAAEYIENADLCAVRRIAAFWQLGSTP